MTKRNVKKTSTNVVKYSEIRSKVEPQLSYGAQTRAPKGRKKASQGNKNLPHFVRAMVNPFSSDAFGVKVPDDSTAPTIPAISRDLVSLSTDATYGNAVALYRPHPYISGLGANAITAANTWNWPAALTGALGVGNSPVLVSNFRLVRPVVWGVKIQSRQSALNASGFVHVALVPDLNAATAWNYPTTVTSMQYAPYYRRIPIADLIKDQAIIMGAYTDSTAFRYKDPGASDLQGGVGGIIQASGWLAMLIVVEGPTSVANAVDIEILRHWECIPQVTSAAVGLLRSTLPSPHSPLQMAAASYVNAAVDNIRVIAEDANESDYFSGVAKVFEKGMQIAKGVNLAGNALGMW